MKWVKFWVSGHFLENPLRKWPEILHDLGFLDILVMLCRFSSMWCPFDWNWSYFGFPGIIWRMCGSTCQGWGGGIFLMLCIQFSSSKGCNDTLSHDMIHITIHHPRYGSRYETKPAYILSMKNMLSACFFRDITYPEALVGEYCGQMSLSRCSCKHL